MVLALEKGRCSSWGVLLCCRRLLALSLASDTKFYHRWHPSERNAADCGSRLWEPCGLLAEREELVAGDRKVGGPPPDARGIAGGGKWEGERDRDRLPIA